MIQGLNLNILEENMLHFLLKIDTQHLFFRLQFKLQLVISESGFSPLSHLVYLSHIVSKLLLKTYIN